MPTLKDARRVIKTDSTQFTDFPSVWSILDRNNVVYEGKGVYSYTGTGCSGDDDVGLIKTVNPLDSSKTGGMASFEIHLTCTGEKRYIAVGVCNDSYPSHSLPGWDKISVGLHMDNGSLFQSSDEVTKTNLVFRDGDSIKCSVRDVPSASAVQHGAVEIAFSCNGLPGVSVVAEKPPGGFYGVVGMMSEGEAITLSLPVASKLQSFEEVWQISTPTLVAHRVGGICSYIGPGDLSKDSIGSARGITPINPSGDLSQRSFSLRIVNSGEKCFIAMGIVNKNYATNLLPGWEGCSVGYHADSGEIFQSSNDGDPTSTPHQVQEGDVMQCVVDCIDKSQKQVRVTFLRNGVKVAAVPAWSPETGFHFCFGIMSKGEVVQVLLPDVTAPFSLPKLEFEEVWAVMNASIEHQGSGTCCYVGEEKVGTIRSKQPLNPFSQTNWFEVKIVEPGKNCYIALGVCSQLYSTNDLPGWEDLSVGYHADEGSILQKTSGQEKVSDPCGKGDVLRCTLEPVDGSDKQMNVIYHKNGSFIGKSILWKPGDGKIFAQIGCMGPGEVIQISSPWQANLQSKPHNPLTSYPSRGRNTGPNLGTLAGDGEEQRWFGDDHQHRDHMYHSDKKGMEKFFQDMYHQLHGLPHPSGLQLPFVGAEAAAPGTNPAMHFTPRPVGWQQYRGYGRNPQFLSSLLPDDFRQGSHLAGNPKYLQSQQSEPVTKENRPNYYSAFSSSSAPSAETPSLYSTQFSQSSVSSLDSVPEGTCIRDERGLEDYAREVRQHQPLPPHPDEKSLQLSKNGSSSNLASLASGPLCPRSSIDGEITSLSGNPKETTSLYPSGSLASTHDVETLTLPSTETVRASHESIAVQRYPNTVVEPAILTKDENRMFKILHNVEVASDGALECAHLNLDSPDNSFIMFRLPLNEKCNYFEVEILQLNCDSNVAVGCVWDHHPVYHLPGVLEGSIAYHGIDGAILCGRQAECTNTPCAVGDVIGCRIILKYKSEIIIHSDKNNKNEGLVEIEFFRNGILLCAEEVFLPPNGFFPAVGMTGCCSKVRVCSSMLRTPETYFQTHPLPDGYLNFPKTSGELEGWQCLQGSKIDGDRLYGDGESGAKPAVIQSNYPFTRSSDYFHIQLQSDIVMYSVLSVGVSSKLSSEAIPGEVPNSVSYFPLLGFFMSSGVICWTVPEIVSSNLSKKGLTIGVGMQHCDAGTCSTSISDSPKFLARAKLFFTLNGQQIHDIFTEVPEGGLYPTLAIERAYDISSDSLAIVEFPHPYPFKMQGLPFGFSRGTFDSVFQLSTSCPPRDKLGACPLRLESSPVRVVQAAQPLSPTRSYFEVRILCGGGTFKFSCGLAGYDYPLNMHPGLMENSIALHADDGNLFMDGQHTSVTTQPCYDGALLGCGIRFPDDSTRSSAEVFFTLNKKMVASRLVKVPQMGLYPTIGTRTNEGQFELNIHAQDPYPTLKFKTAIEFMENMEIDGSTVNLISSPNPGAIQMCSCASLQEGNFMQVSCLSKRTGRIMIGFSTGKSCPQNFVRSRAFNASMIDIVSGKLMVFNQYFRVRDTCPILNDEIFGIGLEPIPDSNKLLLFTTSNGYIVSYNEVDVEGAKVYPCVMMVDSTTKLEVDLCSSWPQQSPAGYGWAVCANLKLVDLKITHSCVQIKKRLPVGYAQAAVPLTSSSSYFEVEICSRAANKAIAIGLASRTHSSTQWIGWSENSIGYHTDDGKLFKESSAGQSFGPKIYSGDTIGCGARLGHVCVADCVNCNRKTKVEVYFTINGALLNTQKMVIPTGGFFPTLCLESPSESVIFHRYKAFPPVDNLVDSTDWENAYSVKQVGITLSNSCRHKEINGGLPKAFCQARLPFGADKPYFQVEITSRHKGNILVGASVKIPVGCTSPNTHSVLYNNTGQVITRKGSQKSSRTSSKCGVGDIIGCCISFSNAVPCQANIYINYSKVHTVDLLGLWNPQELYPTIILAQPGDSVIPTLQMKFPSWNRPPLIGWLRSERVQVHNNIIEYTGQAKNLSDIGVAQISQPFHVDSMPYYEVKIIECGKSCVVGVGAASAEYPLSMQPGWCKDSIAYHGDDGKLFHQAGVGVPFASTWKEGDVIGLGIRQPSGLNLVENSLQVYFTKNGVELGHTTAFLPLDGFFPIIGLHDIGLTVKISLGLPHTLPCNRSSLRSQWHSLCGIDVEESPSGHLLGYRMGGRISTNKPLSLAMYAQQFSVTMQYFEVELHSIGSIRIAVGVAPHSYPLDQTPGWCAGSIAYHTINGCLYNGSAKGKEFGPVAHTGDVIGCGLNFFPNNINHCSIFFTYNGMEIGRVRAMYPRNGLYPVVALTDCQDKVSVKFHETFKPRLSSSEVKFVNIMRINNCSYSEQIVSFKGFGNTRFSSAPAMAQFSVPLKRERSYYATNIVECKDNILIGLAVKDYPLHYAPGTTSISLAYDILKGSIRAVYDSENFFTADAPFCKQGDSVGCGIHFSDDVKTACPYVYFTHNHKLVLKVDISDDFLLEDFYPIVGFIPKNRSSFIFMDWNNFTFEECNVF